MHAGVLFVLLELPFHPEAVQAGSQKFREASSTQPADSAAGWSAGRGTGDSAEGRAGGVCMY